MNCQSKAEWHSDFIKDSRIHISLLGQSTLKPFERFKISETQVRA